MKGLSPVIATILLLLITVSVITIAFSFFSRITETATTAVETSSESVVSRGLAQLSIDNIAPDRLYIRNTGSREEPPASVAVYINNMPVNVTVPAIGPGALVQAVMPSTFTMTEGAGSTIKIMDGFNSVTRRISIIPKSCRGVFDSKTGVTNGMYTIRVNDNDLQVYCDAVTDGGGWTLVLLNTPYLTPPKPNWTAAINGNTITGNMSNGVTSGFDQILGLAYWNSIGNEMRVQIGANPSSLNHSMTYNFRLNTTNNYSLNLTNPVILVNTGGTAWPGIYTNAAYLSLQFSTFDADHDTHTGACSTFYGNTPWWYDNCWSGSYWGGGDGGGYMNSPYWTDSASEYFPWGAIWVR